MVEDAQPGETFTPLVPTLIVTEGETVLPE
jgi:hypothetical protein